MNTLALFVLAIPAIWPDEPQTPAKSKWPTSKALEERQIGFQKFILLPGVKVKAKSEATLDMIYATGNPRSFLPAATVKKIGAPIVGKVDLEGENDTRASLGLSGANPKNQRVFETARIDAWDLGVGPPGQTLEVLVIDADKPG